MARQEPAAFLGLAGRRPAQRPLHRRRGRRPRSAEGDFREYAEDLHRRGFDTVILGHLHLPQFEQRAASARLDSPTAAADREAPAQTYANLGDWVRWRTFLRWEEGRLELRQWSWPEAVERPFQPG